MPRFFFDYRDGHGHLERDDEGLEFQSLEAAYLDATRAAIEMQVDACCEGQCATEDSLEIRDDSGNVLVILPFDEALSRKP